eukprot:jgi/Bigna1/78462/fgenesh1_pg.55_\
MGGALTPKKQCNLFRHICQAATGSHRICLDLGSEATDLGSEIGYGFRNYQLDSELRNWAPKVLGWVPSTLLIVITIESSRKQLIAADARNTQIIASVGQNHSIKIWNIYSSSESAGDNTQQQQQQQLQQQQPCGCCLGRHTRTVTNLSFSMDGKLLVSMSINYIIKIWDIMERSLLKTFTRDGVDRVFFTTDTTIAMKGVYQGGGNFKYWIEFKDAFKKDSKRKVIDLGGGRSFSGEQQQQCCRLSSDGSKFAHWYRKELQIRGTEELRIVHKIKIIDRNMCFEGPVVFSKDCSSIAAVVVEDAEARRSHHQMGLTQRIAYIKVWNLKTAPVNAPASCIFSVKTVTPWIIKFCPMDSRVLASASFSDRKVVDDNPHDVNPRNHRAANMGGRDVRSMNFLFSKDGGTFVLSKTREDFIYDMTMDEDRPMDRITRFTIWKVGDDRRVMSALARDLLQVEMLHKSILVVLGGPIHFRKATTLGGWTRRSMIIHYSLPNGGVI